MRSAVAALSFFILMSATGARAAVLDQSQDNVDSNLFIGTGDARIAQTFTAGLDGELTQVRLRIGYLPGTGGALDASDLLLEVMSVDTAGKPSGTVLATASHAHGDFPLAGGFNDSPYTAFNFGGVPLHRKTQYALALRVASPDQPCASAGASCTPPGYRANDAFASDFYPAGALFSGAGAVPGVQLRGDLSFQTFMSAVPEPQAWLAALLGIGAWSLRGLGRLRR